METSHGRFETAGRERIAAKPKKKKKDEPAPSGLRAQNAIRTHPAGETRNGPCLVNPRCCTKRLRAEPPQTCYMYVVIGIQFARFKTRKRHKSVGRRQPVLRQTLNRARIYDSGRIVHARAIPIQHEMALATVR